MNIESYFVAGLTSSDGEHQVEERLRDLPGVMDIEVASGGGPTACVTIVSARHLDDHEVADALDAAGGYRLA